MPNITHRNGLGRNLTANEVDDNFDALNTAVVAAQATADSKAGTATFTSVASGLAPASGGGTTTFLRADGVFETPPGSGDMVLSSVQTVTGQKTFAAGKLVAASAALTTPTGIVKGDVGLGSVDNTADADKPVSTAQQTALNLKANIASPTFTGTVGGITKSMVGLGNVDNTSDASKPVSTAQQTAIDLKANIASPALTGTPTAPTAAAATNTTQLATTAHVFAERTNTATLTNKTISAPTLSGIVTEDGAKVTTANAMAALAIDVTKELNTKSIAVDSTFTFSATPSTNTWFTLALTNTDTVAHTATIPSSVPEGQSLAITTVNVPASGTVYLTWRYNGTSYQVFGSGVQPGTVVTSKSTAYTTVAGDANTIIYHPTTDNNARTFTIDSNANVAYDIGTAITFVNDVNTVTISITSDTMLLANSATTGSRTLAVGGIATALKLTSTRWIISGVGLT